MGERTPMPQYELMYIIGNQIADDEVGTITDEVKQSIESHKGVITGTEDIGRKKLAYPIKKSRSGYYARVEFGAPSDQVNEIEHRIRTNQNIIRHLIVNMEEAMVRIEKDRAAQSKLRRPRTKEEGKPEPSKKAPSEGGKKIEIDLDAEIEKAIDSNELK